MNNKKILAGNNCWNKVQFYSISHLTVPLPIICKNYCFFIKLLSNLFSKENIAPTDPVIMKNNYGSWGEPCTDSNTIVDLSSFYTFVNFF